MLKSALVLSLICLFSGGLPQALGAIDVCNVLSCPVLPNDGAYCCSGKGPYDWANNLIHSDDVGCCDLGPKTLNWFQNHLQEIVIAAAVLLVALLVLSILCCLCSWCCCC